MKNVTSFGTSRSWWLLLLIGILFVIGGFSYWFWPAAGFAVASVLFGWLLVAVGVVQLSVAGARQRPADWVWWLVGGAINVFVGFMLGCNVFLAEAVLPYFLAFVFLYSGIMALARGFVGTAVNGRWLYFVNGILLLIIGGCFLCGGYLQQMTMVSFLAALAFVYWGFTLAGVALDMKPRKNGESSLL